MYANTLSFRELFVIGHFTNCSYISYVCPLEPRQIFKTCQAPDIEPEVGQYRQTDYKTSFLLLSCPKKHHVSCKLLSILLKCVSENQTTCAPSARFNHLAEVLINTSSQIGNTK